ncbi:hypothetical protein BUALT_Bualt07G0112400 [Buddleja alternifolia]|uniref:NB-ARC domain-containing protein n=1 Tax=Buddleja alternifolia TaxID=168488 RepID=A0AAV6XGG0_9LAMI|nr:hypothetical protein BUALT_Bualt07G0112400 [Buddleja alternifolia]
MAAAYAAVVSLIHVLENVQNPSMDWILLDREQVQALHEKVCSLQDFLEDFYNTRSKLEIKGFESQIAEASHEAEDIIESDKELYIVFTSGKELYMDIEKVMRKMDLIEQKVINVKEKMIMGVVKDQQLEEFEPVVGLSRQATTGKNTLVGFDDHLVQIMEKLDTKKSKLQMISIVGKGGIGKTTLATNVYDNPFIVQHFDVRAWVTISQDYNVREILLRLLYAVDGGKDSIEKSSAFTDKMNKNSDEQLGDQLYKSLITRRYLIVMDDLWSTEAWDEVRRFFPDNSNECRIMVFQQDDCPLDLEKVGKKIAKSCRGLPLAVVVIGGLLAKSNKTREYWEYIAENLNSIVNSGNDEYCLKLLSLSYNHLPIYLKPCFLYMATFPEDCDISVSRLIKLWVAEGFLKPIRTKSLEDVANEYLKDLTDRNLISIRNRNIWRSKICIIHDLLRDLCVREAHKENFLRVIRVESLEIPPHINRIRRLNIHESTKEQSSPRLVSRLNLLRILDVVDKYYSEDIMKLVNLRYLSVTGDRDLNLNIVSSISPFWNLQTFILRGETGPIVLPSRIWEMTQLRTLKSEVVCLPEPQPQIGAQWDAIEGEFVQLKHLTIFKTDLMYWEADYTHFPNLEILYLGCLEMKEIPLGLVTLPLLEYIHLYHCRPSVVTSAKLILEERDNLGYEGLQVTVKNTNSEQWITVTLGDSQ